MLPAWRAYLNLRTLAVRFAARAPDLGLVLQCPFCEPDGRCVTCFRSSPRPPPGLAPFRSSHEPRRRGDRSRIDRAGDGICRNCMFQLRLLVQCMDCRKHMPERSATSCQGCGLDVCETCAQGNANYVWPGCRCHTCAVNTRQSELRRIVAALGYMQALPSVGAAAAAGQPAAPWQVHAVTQLEQWLSRAEEHSGPMPPLPAAHGQDLFATPPRITARQPAPEVAARSASAMAAPPSARGGRSPGAGGPVRVQHTRRMLERLYASPLARPRPRRPTEGQEVRS